MKHFQTFRTVIRKFCKNSIFTSLNRSRGIKHQSKALFDRSNRNWTPIETGRKFRIIFFNISIDRAKVLTDRKTWISNFHLENSKSWIFTLFILQMNILQSYIIITTYPFIYIYIYIKEREREREREINNCYSHCDW